LIGQAYAGFLPNEPQAPDAPNPNQATDNSVSISSTATTPVAQAWVISISSTSTAAPGQVEILRKGGLPAYMENQGSQAVVLVGPNLKKDNLLQQQKIVLELLNTPGTIVPYVSSASS
jgi:cell division septation protein DedD